MRRGGGVGDETLRVAEVVADLDDLERIHAAEGRILAALDLEGDQRAARRHLPLGERGLRMIGAAGIVDARHVLARGEEIGDGRSRGDVPLDANRKRLETFQQHPGIERTERRAGVLEVIVQLLLNELCGPSTTPPRQRPWPSICLVAE